jgi:hypothetical protein
MECCRVNNYICPATFISMMTSMVSHGQGALETGQVCYGGGEEGTASKHGCIPNTALSGPIIQAGDRSSQLGPGARRAQWLLCTAAGERREIIPCPIKVRIIVDGNMGKDARNEAGGVVATGYRATMARASTAHTNQTPGPALIDPQASNRRHPLRFHRREKCWATTDEHLLCPVNCSMNLNDSDSDVRSSLGMREKQAASTPDTTRGFNRTILLKSRLEDRQCAIERPVHLFNADRYTMTRHEPA